MLHLPILRWGVPYRSVNQVVTPHFRTREPFVSMSQANVGLIRRDLLQQAEARALLQKIPVADLVSDGRQGRRSFPERHAAARSRERHDADAAAIRRAGVGDDRHAVQQRAPQHDEGARRARQGRGSARRTDARARSVGARCRIRHGARTDAQLLPAHRCARRRPAQQLSRRAFAVGADTGVEDAARAQARQRRAVDAAAHHQRLGEGGRAGRRVRLLPDRSRRRQRDPAIDAAAAWCSAMSGRRSDGRPTAASKCTARATARS